MYGPEHCSDYVSPLPPPPSHPQPSPLFRERTWARKRRMCCLSRRRRRCPHGSLRFTLNTTRLSKTQACRSRIIWRYEDRIWICPQRLGGKIFEFKRRCRNLMGSRGILIIFEIGFSLDMTEPSLPVRVCTPPPLEGPFNGGGESFAPVLGLFWSYIASTKSCIIFNVHKPLSPTLIQARDM